MRSNNSIGLSYEAVRQLKESRLVDHIVIELQEGFKKRKLKTTPEYYLAHGEPLHFKKNNLELQIFLRIDLFGLREVKKWKNEQDKVNTAMVIDEK